GRDRAERCAAGLPLERPRRKFGYRMFAPPFCRRLFAATLSGLLGAGSAAAQAPGADVPAQAPTPLALTWESSEPSCAGASVAQRALESLAPGVTPRPTQAHAKVGRDGEQWLVELETRSESRLGRRTLRGESCQEIQNAITLLLAMILESEAKAEAVPAPVLPEPVLGTGPDPGSPEIDTPPQRPASPAPLRFGGVLRSEATAALGLQPSLGLGIGGSIGAALGPFELQVGGAYWPASRQAIFD